jgi:hypothetical protein
VERLTYQAKPGREGAWDWIMTALASEAQRAGDYPKAEKLFHKLIASLRERWRSAKGSDPESDKLTGNNLASALKSYAYMLRDKGEVSAADLLREAFQIAVQLGLQRLQADVASDLGEIYREMPAVRDLAQAEIWMQIALKLRGAQPSDARSELLLRLSQVRIQRFLSLADSEQGTRESRGLLDAAIANLQQARRETSQQNQSLLMMIEFQLGAAYGAMKSTAEAQNWLKKVLLRATALRDQGVISTVYVLLAHIAEEHGLSSEARVYAKAAMENNPARTPYDAEIRASLSKLLDPG